MDALVDLTRGDSVDSPRPTGFGLARADSSRNGTEGNDISTTSGTSARSPSPSKSRSESKSSGSSGESASANAAAKAPPPASAKKARTERVALSTLPLSITSKAVNKGSGCFLVELPRSDDSDITSLSNKKSNKNDNNNFNLKSDVGAVGRFQVDERGMTLDLKGRRFSGKLMPTNTFMVVSITHSQAKVERILCDYVKTEDERNILSAMGPQQTKGAEKVVDFRFSGSVGHHDSNLITGDKAFAMKSGVFGGKKSKSKGKGKGKSKRGKSNKRKR